MIHIDEPETLRSQYRQAKNKRDWIAQNAQCLDCTSYELGTWLREQGEEVDLRRLAGNPALRKSHKHKARDKAELETAQDNVIMLTSAEASIIRQYVDKYHEAHEDSRDDEIMIAADRLATALDVILTIAAARDDV